MDQLWMDIRYSMRVLRKNPAFALVAILVLALGIGATTAIFSVVNAVLIRPLPYKDPSRLVALSTDYQRPGFRRIFPTVTLVEVERWRSESHSFDSLGSFVFSALPVNIGSQAMFLVAIGADPELLSTLGIQPTMGRNFAGTGSKVREPSIIISHRLWVDAFQSDPRVLGRSLIMDGDIVTVAGVLPASFQFPRSDAAYSPEAPDIVYPVANIVETWNPRSAQWFAIGRLKAGVAMQSAESELRTINTHLVESEPDLRGMSVHLSMLDSETTGSVRTALLLTLGISLVLLLIACTNIMNLLFSRAAQRGREIAVRKAVGASAWRLVRQMLTESACLTFLAGAFGLLVARLVLDTLVRLSPAHLPISGQIEIDWTVLGFVFMICTTAAILAGVLPAFQRSRQSDSLIVTTRSSSSRALLGFQRVLMVSQIALGVGLLAAAGLLAHSLFRLSSVNPGFRTKDTIGFEVAFPSGRHDEAPQHYDRILQAVREVPGVTSAGWITNLPPETRAGVFMGFSLPGSPKSLVSNFQVTSEDYFGTAGIALSRGRDFTRADSATAPAVAIVNEAFARQVFPNEDPIGKRVVTLFAEPKPREIVGVIRDIHDRGLNAKSVATVYLPYRQFAVAYGGVVVRTTAPPESVIPEIQRRVAAADPTVPVKNAMTIESRLHRTLDAPRFYTIMSASCAAMAFLFVALGLYGVISYAVSRRTSEIGIRMALGAPQDLILRGVLWQGLQMAAAGVAMGIGLALATTRLLRTLLFEIKPIDPVTLAIAAALVVLVTLAASYIPARRASQVQPLAALRQE